MSNLEKILWILFAIILGFGVYWGFAAPDYFTGEFMKEDGFIEYSTVVILLASCLLVFKRWKSSLLRVGIKFTVVSWLIILAFFFVAGEEMSWGQRIFGIETTEYFKENNAQEEINLHNLTVGGVKINKLIFGLILNTIIMIYVFLIPLLYYKFPKVRRFLDSWYIPIPQWWQSVGYLVLVLIISLIPASKNWELLEFGSVLIFYLILLNPRNKPVLEPIIH